MSELILPLKNWKTDYKTEWRKEVWKEYYKSEITHLKGVHPKILIGKKLVRIKISAGFYRIHKKIQKETLSKWDLKFLTYKYSYFVVTDFILNDIGLFAVIENLVFNELVKCDFRVEKKFFRERTWEELIKRVMRPKRLVKMSALYGLDLVEYMEQMGF
jgi:hypothetical protein